MERHYQVLGIRPGASKKQVQKAYHEMMKVWHPDRFPNDPELQKKAEERTREINEAYRAILDGAPAPSPVLARPAPAPRAEREERPRRGGLWIFALLLAAFVGGCAWYFANFDASRALRVGVPMGETWSRRFHLGSTKDEVFAVQGAPAKMDGDTWRWGADWVRFTAGRVDAWSNGAGALHVVYDPKLKPAREGWFTIGSSKEDVARIEGTPTALLGDEWAYGRDRLFFSRGKLERYDNTYGRLNVKVYPAEAVRVFGERFAKGSTKDEVLAVQGTPTKMTDDVWHWGLDSVTFSKDRVFSVSNKTGLLKSRD